MLVLVHGVMVLLLAEDGSGVGGGGGSWRGGSFTQLKSVGASSALPIVQVVWPKRGGSREDLSPSPCVAAAATLVRLALLLCPQ